VAIRWAVPAICFVPVIYALVISWLGEREDPSREPRDASSAPGVPFGLPRPREAGDHLAEASARFPVPDPGSAAPGPSSACASCNN